MMQSVRRQSPYLLTMLSIITVAMVYFSFYVQASSVQLGGWLSSKLFEQAGQVDSQILFDRTGQPDSLLIFATAPTMTTSPATGVTISGITGTAVLHGTLTDLNGMPSADVGFRWGYTLGTMTTLTSTTHVTGTGAYSITLNGFDPFTPVYFQAVGTTDGTNYGSGIGFSTPRAMDNFTGLDLVLTITPLILWVSLLIASGVFIYRGTKGLASSIGNGVEIGIGFIALTIWILMFPLIINIIQTVRLLP